MPLLAANHSFKTCGGLEPTTSTTVSKNCGGGGSLGGQERYILKAHQEGAPHPKICSAILQPTTDDNEQV